MNVMNEVELAYDPDRQDDLHAGDVCALLGVTRSHLPNLRANGTLRGYQLFPGAHWRYPPDQPALREAVLRRALRRQALVKR